MKIISEKQKNVAISHVAALLKTDGQIQTRTVQQWLDVAELHPSQFQCSLPTLQVLDLLGFGGELVPVKELG